MSSISPSVALDWTCWDNLEAVSYVSTATSGQITYALPSVMRRALTWRELAASGGVYTAQDRAWLVPTSTLPSGCNPKPADKVIDASSTIWTVLEAPLNTLQSWYKLVCRNIVLAYQLQDTINVFRPDGSVSASGQRTANMVQVYIGLPARCQLNSADRVDVRGKYVLEQSWTVYVQGPLTFQSGDQIVDQAGTIYEVRGHEEPNLIDKLQAVHCKRWE